MKLKFSFLLVISVLAFGLTGCLPVNVEPLSVDTDDVTQLKYSHTCGFCPGDNGVQSVEIDIDREARVIKSQASVTYSTGEPLICTAQQLTGGDYVDFVDALKLLKIKTYTPGASVILDAPTTWLTLISRNGSELTRQMSDSNGLNGDSFTGYEKLQTFIQRLQAGCKGKREPGGDFEIQSLRYYIQPQGMALPDFQFAATVEITRSISEDYFKSRVRVKRGSDEEKVCAVRTSSENENAELVQALAPVNLGTTDSLLACGAPDILEIFRKDGRREQAEVEMTGSMSKTVFQNTADLRRIIDVLVAECK